MIEGELGAFLRSRREAVKPADVGLPAGSRRRTPGLRRAELATLAGISVDYLTRLEQGRDTRPSTQVLAALAEVLRLSDDELNHLQELATVSNGTELLCAQSRDALVITRDVRPTVYAVLRQLEPAPAVVMNHLTDLLAWNDGYDRLARPLGVLDAERPNLLSFTFTDERAPAAYPGWEEVADDQVATLHELRHGDAGADTLAARLAEAAGNAFTHRWRRRPVGARRTGHLALGHPVAGALRLTFETLDLAGPGRQRLVVYLPADAPTSTGLDLLTGRRPGGLRSVSGG
ncbi:helix-turn-helix transcriptional regulator [Qaidamihabitans albus]|uniref:helix-turn-helix transcriptional regulator n=1 Tax=Qaidamihabitans albus TaxID=2795733 RepID=UPI0018F1F2D2|nr:helix-turn-helix transcriptional regulator [Qaidamihabitans albus]